MGRWRRAGVKGVDPGTEVASYLIVFKRDVAPKGLGWRACMGGVAKLNNFDLLSSLLLNTLEQSLLASRSLRNGALYVFRGALRTFREWLYTPCLQI